MKKRRTFTTWIRTSLMLFMALLMLNSSVMPNVAAGNEIISGTLAAQAASVSYQKIYFTNGLTLLPEDIISFSWTKMRKGDTIIVSARSTGTISVGIYRQSDRKMIGVTRSGDFTASIRVPSDGYYRVYILNKSPRSVSVKGSATCIR